VSDMVTRRKFVVGVGAVVMARRMRGAGAAHVDAKKLVEAQDRERILRNAEQWLHAAPQTVTAFRSPRSPGGPNDFYSEADYFWPNPKDPQGLPYKEIDGKSNPDNFLEHRKAMIRLSLAVPALTAAYVLTGKLRYAEVARAHLHAWFVDPKTRMTPNLQYAQAVIHGVTKGRGIGIIDTLHLVEVARAAGSSAPACSVGVTGIFRYRQGRPHPFVSSRVRAKSRCRDTPSIRHLDKLDGYSERTGRGPHPNPALTRVG